MPFPSELREKVLLWCDRRCCICKRGCDLLIEVHHIVPESKGGSNDEDNAIPLCFDCHAKVHFNDSQPIGTKYKADELKKRRNQVYDECTRHLAPILSYRVIQDREPPQASFQIRHTGNAPWVKAKVNLEIFLDGKLADNPNCGLYSGTAFWHLNPGEGVDGLFTISTTSKLDRADVRVGINIEIFDMYDHLHGLLPISYVLQPESWEWYLDPMPVQDSAKQWTQLTKDRPTFLHSLNIPKSLNNVGGNPSTGTIPSCSINEPSSPFPPGLTGPSGPIVSR